MVRGPSLSKTKAAQADTLGIILACCICSN